MSTPTIRYCAAAATLLLAFALVSVAAPRAQQGSPAPNAPPSLQHPGQPQQPGMNPGATGQSPQSSAPAPGAQPEVPKVNPQEEADYKALFDSQDPGTKIKLGQDFLGKYPASHYTQGVYEQLVNAYSAEKDWKNFYATADKALTNNPDDVQVLVYVGWVTPHIYNSKLPDAKTRLDNAENYEKRALDLINQSSNNGAMPDDQFSAAKAGFLREAHSALGMIDFRRGDNADCVQELQQAIAGDASPDPGDYFVMGMAQEQLKNFSAAADSFGKCSLVPGGLQDRCKQAADRVQKESPQTK